MHVKTKNFILQYTGTEACSSSEIEENRKGRKKLLLTKTKCYKASKFLSKNDLAKSLFCHEPNFCSLNFPLKNLNIKGVFRTQPNISGDFLQK